VTIRAISAKHPGRGLALYGISDGIGKFAFQNRAPPHRVRAAGASTRLAVAKGGGIDELRRDISHTTTKTSAYEHRHLPELPHGLARA